MLLCRIIPARAPRGLFIAAQRKQAQEQRAVPHDVSGGVRWPWALPLVALVFCSAGEKPTPGELLDRWQHCGLPANVMLQCAKHDGNRKEELIARARLMVSWARSGVALMEKGKTYGQVLDFVRPLVKTNRFRLEALPARLRDEHGEGGGLPEGIGDALGLLAGSRGRDTLDDDVEPAAHLSAARRHRRNAAAHDPLV